MSTYWQQFRSRQLAIEKKFVGAIYNELRAQNQAFLTSINKNGYNYSKANINRIVKPDGIIKILKRLYRECAWRESRFVFSSLIKRSRSGKKSLDLIFKRTPDASFGVGFDQIADVVDEYFRIYQFNKSGVPITNTTKKYIGNHLIDEVDRGVPLDEAIRNFRTLALDGRHNASRSRAKLIIQTESLRAMSFGQMIGAYQSGVDVDRVWVTCNDERVRKAPFSHRTLDRQVASLFGSFYNGEQIKFPGDPEASKLNTLGCRCTQFFKEKEKPKPRIRTRNIANFLTDFFAGFLISQAIEETILSTGEARIMDE